MNIVEHLRYRARTRNTGVIVSSEDTETMGYYGAGSAKFDYEAAARFEQLEAALRDIAKDDDGPVTMAKIARAALDQKEST